jgi:lipopolysaccharide/colanic/teichoic acid biosynthesis glycosyltransferase
MSVVGPRPERPEIALQYQEELPEFALRLRMKAGLTGYAQIYGRYNTTMRDKLLLDLLYTENFSILLDCKMIFMTVKILFMPESTEGIAEGALLPTGEIVGGAEDGLG